jgi:hypothetical protein
MAPIADPTHAAFIELLHRSLNAQSSTPKRRERLNTWLETKKCRGSCTTPKEAMPPAQVSEG